jgi:transcriptional regulator with XRE-family HTH domain
MAMGLTQSDLANCTGVTFQQVQKYERGVNRISASRLQEFSQLLQVPVVFFFEGGPGADMRPHGNTAPTDFIAKFHASPDGLELANAFLRIKDKRLQRSIVELVEQIMEVRSTAK